MHVLKDYGYQDLSGIDFWGAIKKGAKTVISSAVKVVTSPAVMGIISKAVSFIPGVGPIISTGLDAITTAVKKLIPSGIDVSKVMNDITTAGKTIATSGGSINATPEQQAVIKAVQEVAVKNPNIMATDIVQGALTDAKNGKSLTDIQKGIKEDETKKVNNQNNFVDAKKNSGNGGAVVTNNGFSLFNDDATSFLNAKSQPTKQDEFKIERKKVDTNVKNLKLNIKTINNKIDKYFGGIFKSAEIKAQKNELTARTYDIEKRLNGIIKEMDDLKSLKAEPMINIGFTGGLTILSKYDNELVSLNTELKKINSDIDSLLQGEKTTAETTARKKLAQKESKIDSKTKQNLNPKLPFNWKNLTVPLIIFGVVGVIGFAEFKFLKNRKA